MNSIAQNLSRSRIAALIAAAIIGLGFTTPALAGDATAGAEKAAPCKACHGADFKTPTDPSYAILAGQHEGYLLEALKQYKSGVRKHAIMGAMAAPLSNDDIADLAAYITSLPGPLGYKR